MGNKVEQSPQSGVYLIRNADGLYKIGCTSDRANRLKAYKDVVLVRFFSSDSYRLLERELHSFFFEKRITGEWFALDAVDLTVLSMLPDEVQRPELEKIYALFGTIRRARIDTLRHYVKLFAILESTGG